MTLTNSSLTNNSVNQLHPYTLDTTPNTAVPVPSSPMSCGKKHENLMLLHTLQSRSREKFVTPVPFGLTTEEVEPYLRKKAPEFFTGWQELKTRYEQDPVLFFKDEAIIDLIEKVKDHVITAFAGTGAPWEARLNQWLKPDSYFMVRSSGSEDGKAANAGGNLSLNYVRPEEVGPSMGKVIASYFDKRSLQNQSKGGTNPFAACPLSVTVQELIGEPMGGEKDPANIPVSAVLFSNEPLYIGNEEFRMMRLSATRGHGEGVVGNEGIATDTFIVLQSRVHPDKLYVVDNIPSKPERLAPVDGKLQPVPNPRELIDAPTVDKAMLQRLFNIGIEVEQDLFAGKPADIELVIKKDVIHLVQAREVNRPLQTTPRYLNLEDCSAKTQAMKVLIPGHMQAEVLDDPSQILVIDTLEEAQFREGNFKLVIVKNDEPANSHPMINFSERGIHVFYSPEGFELPVKEEKILICPQQGIVACGDPSSFKFKEGYIEHPAPVQFSSPPLPFLTPNKELVEKLNSLIRQLKAENCTEVALKALEDLKTFPAVEAFNKKVTEAKAFSEPAQRLHKVFQSTLEELGESLKKGSRLENLFYIKAIKSLLTDSPFSVLSLTQVLDQTIAFEQKASEKLSKEVVIETLDPKTKAQWEAFLLDVDKTASEAEITAFQRLLETLGSLKPLWLTFYFAPRQGKLSSQELLQELLGQMDEVSFNFVEQLKHQPFRYFKEQVFIDNFKNSCPLARLIALRYLFQAIDSQDKKLKALQLSSQPLNTKILAFKKELISYLELMKIVAKELIGEGKFNFINGENLQSYFEFLDDVTIRIYDKADALELLKPSNFNVAAAKLDACTLFGGHPPRTLEDLFTLTHQNLLACIALLYKENLPPLETLDLPDLLKEANKKVFDLDRASRIEVNLIGIEQQGETLTLNYNIPQHNHSSTCQLQFKNGVLHFSAQMLGNSRGRWEKSKGFIQMLNEWNVLSCKKLVQRGDVLDAAWLIEDTDQMKIACEVLSTIHESALHENNQLLLDYLCSSCKNAQWLISNLIKSAERLSHSQTFNTATLFLRRLLQKAQFEDEFFQQADKILAFAKKDLTSPNSDTRDESLQLIECLVNLGVVSAKEEATKLLQMIANDQICINQSYISCNFFINLIEKKNALPDLLKFAQKLLSSSFKETRCNALDLFVKLHKQKEMPLEALAIAEKLVVDPSPEVRAAFAYKLLYLLPADESLNFAKQLFNDPDKVVLSTLRLFLDDRKSTCYTQNMAFYKSLQQAQIDTYYIDWKRGLEDIAHEANLYVGYSQYGYRSPLASLYQKILTGNDEAEIKKCFLNLPTNDCNLIQEVLTLPRIGLKEQDIDDRNIFNDAVQQALIVKFNRLPQKEKTLVYDKICIIERYTRTPWEFGATPHPREWGEKHCKEDLLRLASALP
jgi:hypothetical protein